MMKLLLVFWRNLFLYAASIPPQIRNILDSKVINYNYLWFAKQ